jgi:hypothetical protein
MFIVLDPHPHDRLTVTERRLLSLAFHRRTFGKGRYKYLFKTDASNRQVLAALRIVRKLEVMERPLPSLPTPPVIGEWRVWHQRKQGVKYESLIMARSLRPYLSGARTQTRRQQAMRMVRHVEQFRRTAPPWWFTFWSTRLVTD